MRCGGGTQGCSNKIQEAPLVEGLHQVPQPISHGGVAALLFGSAGPGHRAVAWEARDSFMGICHVAPCIGARCTTTMGHCSLLTPQVFYEKRTPAFRRPRDALAADRRPRGDRGTRNRT